MQVIDRSKPLAVQYAHDVLDGRVTVGRLVRLAVERDLHDQRTAAARGLVFDDDEADRRVRWFSLCRQIDGEFEGQPLVLEPWQAWFTWVSYGWKRTTTGLRRFRHRWLEVGSGNGKTTMMAADALGALIVDQESGAEIYPVATHREQAKILWDAAARMIEQSPALTARVKLFDSVNNQRILYPDRHAFMVPLGRDSKNSSVEGKKPHAIYFDEVHEYRDRKQWTVLRKKMLKRRQPLSTAMTTAGDDEPETLYEDVHDYCVSVLEGWRNGDFVDDEQLAVIYALDDDDDPYTADVTEDQVLDMFRKANPNLGINIRPEDLVAQWRRGFADPNERASLLRYSCNRRTSTNVREIAAEDWDACADRTIDWAALAAAAVPCVAAFDLSSTRDLTSIAVLYWHDGRPYYRWFSFLPRERLRAKCDEDLVPYDQWAEEGWLELTPGDQIDDEYIARRIGEIDAECSPRQWTADPWHSKFVCNVVAREHGLEVVSFKQDLSSFGEPVMHFLDELRSGRMRHDGNPLARWCATNVVTKEDAHGNRQFHKRASRKRIDPIVAATMARGRAIVLDLSGPPPATAWDGQIEVWA